MAYTITQYGHPHWDGEWWEDGSIKRVIYHHTNGVSRSETQDPHWNAKSVYRPKPTQTELIWNGTEYIRSSVSTTYGQAEVSLPAWTYGWKYFTRVRNSTYGWWPLEGPDICTSEPPDPMNRLISKFRANAPNIANMLGEYKETANMFSHVGRQILQSLWLARHGHIVAACDALGIAVAPLKRNGKKGLSNAYLQWHFGVETLMGDLKLSLDTIRKGCLTQKPLFTRATVKSRNEGNGSTDSTFGNFGGIITRSYISRWDKILIGYVEWNTNELRAAADHGITNPVATLWELLWSSYIVDWFFDVGSWLTALDFPFLTDRTICYEINRSFDVSSFNASHRVYGDATAIVSVNDAAVRVCRKTSRKIRLIRAVLPQWQPHASTTRALVTLALFGQIRSSGGKLPPFKRLNY